MQKRRERNLVGENNNFTSIGLTTKTSSFVHREDILIQDGDWGRGWGGSLSLPVKNDWYRNEWYKLAALLAQRDSEVEECPES